MTVDHTRRSFIAKTSAFLLVGACIPKLSFARKALITPKSFDRKLSLYNAHTGEWFKGTYKSQNKFVPEALTELNKFLRDWRNDAVHPIDPRLLDLVYDLQKGLATTQPFDIISAYRSPQTNAMLCEKSNGVAKKSLHISGAAIDIRISKRLKNLRDLARRLNRGGVGYYPSTGFVHVDIREKPTYWAA